MKALASFISPHGTPIYGAVAAIARHLGVAHNTVKRWASGEWTPSRHKKGKILAMIYDGVQLKRKKVSLVSGSKYASCKKRKHGRKDFA